MQEVEEQSCRKCGLTKPIGDFYYNRSRKKRATSCRQCNSNTCKTYQRESGYRDTVKYVFYQRAYEIKVRCKSKGIGHMDGLEDYLKSLWYESQACYYTGETMAINGYHKNPLAMTVDRKDPAQGYFPGNIVLCCSMANRMKQNLTPSELIDWCLKIVNHLNGSI